MLIGFQGYYIRTELSGENKEVRRRTRILLRRYVREALGGSGPPTGKLKMEN